MDDDTFNQYRMEKKKEHIQTALRIASLYMEHLQRPEVVEKASARDSAIVTGTLIDKAQLLAGDPTIISESKQSTPEMVQEMDQKLGKLKQLIGKTG